MMDPWTLSCLDFKNWTSMPFDAQLFLSCEIFLKVDSTVMSFQQKFLVKNPAFYIGFTISIVQII